MWKIIKWFFGILFVLYVIGSLINQSNNNIKPNNPIVIWASRQRSPKHMRLRLNLKYHLLNLLRKQRTYLPITTKRKLFRIFNLLRLGRRNILKPKTCSSGQTRSLIKKF